MQILVLNAGSASLKFGVFDTGLADSRILKGEFEGFAGGHCTLHLRLGGEQGRSETHQAAFADIAAAIASLPHLLQTHGFTHFDAIGHRVVHGGTTLHGPARIDADLLARMDACVALAPLHMPANLQAIRLSLQLWPYCPQVAVFDTAFHHTMPAYASTYAVPAAWREAGVRRYGFHGTSHKYVALHAAEAMHSAVTDLRIISCHLGNGASVCAIQHGFSLDTSMGMTPMEGLVMGSRAGDVDPGLFSYLSRTLGLDIADIEHALNHDSGLKALAGSADLRAVEQLAAQGDANAQLAIQLYAYRVRKYIGAYAAAMGGVDVVVFTGGIGEHSATMRRRICERLEFLGLYLDDSLNTAVDLQGFEVLPIHAQDSRIKVMVTQTNEQWMIAREVQHLCQQAPIAASKIPVAVSARHVHLSPAALEALFGPGYQLTRLRTLSQPEGWAAQETLVLSGPKGHFDTVRILGPTRAETQIEVSRTDTFVLGVDAPVRPSGQLQDTPTITLRGPYGEIRSQGLIIAARHIHMSPEDAAQRGLKDGDYVEVRLGEGIRGVSFANTLIRVKPGFVTEMHIDTDEANAAGIQVVTQGELVHHPQEVQADVLASAQLGLRHHTIG